MRHTKECKFPALFVLIGYVVMWQMFAAGMNAYDQNKKCECQFELEKGENCDGEIFRPFLANEELFACFPLMWPIIFYETGHFHYGFQYSQSDF